MDNFEYYYKITHRVDNLICDIAAFIHQKEGLGCRCGCATSSSERVGNTTFESYKDLTEHRESHTIRIGINNFFENNEKVKPAYSQYGTIINNDDVAMALTAIIMHEVGHVIHYEHILAKLSPSEGSDYTEDDYIGMYHTEVNSVSIYNLNVSSPAEIYADLIVYKYFKQVVEQFKADIAYLGGMIVTYNKMEAESALSCLKSRIIIQPNIWKGNPAWSHLGSINNLDVYSEADISETEEKPKCFEFAGILIKVLKDRRAIKDKLKVKELSTEHRAELSKLADDLKKLANNHDIVVETAEQQQRPPTVIAYDKPRGECAHVKVNDSTTRCI